MALRPSRSTDATIGVESTTALVEDAVRAIQTECAVALGSDAVVRAACDRLRAVRSTWWIPPHPDLLAALLPFVATHTGALAQTLFALIEDLAEDAPDPLPFVSAMLSARETSLARRGIETTERLTAPGRVPVNRALLMRVASAANDNGALLSRELFESLARWLLSSGCDLGASYVDADARPLQRLAARVLDTCGRPTAETVRRVLGNESAEFLIPYLDYTRATHLDLLDLQMPADGSQTGTAPPCLASLQDAERVCGSALLRRAIDAIGWQHLNCGLEVRRVTGLSVGSGLPLFLSAGEAEIFERCRDAERAGDYFVLIGHGEAGATSTATTAGDDRIARFRAANLVHAEALAEFLDLSPLHRTRVERLLGMMDRLTADFVALFSKQADECAPVAGAYADLRGRIVSALESGNDAEVVRLVQPFEDPATPAEIRSLHGLKRYLHQRSLKLAFRLVEGSRGTNRAATPVVASRDDVIATGRPIEYVDFEPLEDERGRAPYSVQIVIDAFAHQMLHGVTELPLVRVYCYGNEVQYFVAFRNHPVFVRVDFSPPAGGGMIDLEYYGVSKYELSEHPNLGLDAIRACFERLDFALAIENTRIHARYDKERARDTADLCARAEALFRLAPYLMDLDWQLGALDVSPSARREIERAWADVLARWGVLPIEQLTTSDHRRILLGYEYGPTGATEVAWRGDGPYRDRVTTVSSMNFLADARQVVDEMGLAGDLALTAEDIAQVPFERKVLRALRQTRESRKHDLHEAESLACLLVGDDAALEAGARLALLVVQLERLLRFSSVGAINGYDVQRAELALPGEVLAIAVLRDDSGIARVACFSRSDAGNRPSADPQAFASILRRRNFPLAVDVQREADAPPTLRALFGSRSRRMPPIALAGEFLVTGTRAASGRAVGLARFRSERSAAADLEGAIFITPHLSPDEGPFLMRAAGVMATGGGVLSHAGLLAAQFERPAIVAGGTWRSTRGLNPYLQIETTEHETRTTCIGAFEVTVKRHVRAGVLEIRDGDLVELDADEGVARVYGQDRESLALHDAITQLATASERVATATDPAEVLVERGRQLRAVHLLEHLLAQIERPALVAHAVRELLVGRGSAVRVTAPREHAALVRALVESPAAGAGARDCATAVHTALSQKLAASCASALRDIPVAADVGSVLLPRLTMLRDAATVKLTADALSAGGVRIESSTRAIDLDALDELTAARVRELRSEIAAELDARAADPGGDGHLAHAVEAFDRCDALVGPDVSAASNITVFRRLVSQRQQQSLVNARRARIAGAGHGGLELRPIIGGKAANLAEIAQLAGPALVPAWFAVTAGALENVLAMRVPAGGTLRDAIEHTSAGRADEQQRARAIAALFEDAELPPDLVEEIRRAYRELDVTAGGGAPRRADGQLLVAVRSSAGDEDTWLATHAGEFDTFLCVAGDEELVRCIRRAWSGFWNARALYGRAALGQPVWPTCGAVIVQRMVAARAAGVVQTINAGDRRAGEMVINAAFGLGAGIVSGTVAADHVILSKAGLLNGDLPLRFRYATADKRQQVVFDSRAGNGTLLTDTLYHQRMRPALEYPQLADLARAAARLERAYGYALDIEFAFDDRQLWILQARPVPAWFAALRETREKYPLSGHRGR